ncbi:hypothetical protein JCM12294_29290 [Desulfocicer niacini]
MYFQNVDNVREKVTNPQIFQWKGQIGIHESPPIISPNQALGSAIQQSGA